MLTLLSDFGLSDVYVGVMKGVIAQIHPDLTVVDLTHEIPPQNIAAARFSLMSAYPYFPSGTVHVAVVDPGVGGTRRAIAVQFATGYLVGPDNGLFSGVLSQSPALSAVELTNSEYWRTPNPSSTFHGRDIFAPVGAYLAKGVPLTELGRFINPATLVQLMIPDCFETRDGWVGVVQGSDRFGNLITNIPGTLVQAKNWAVSVRAITIQGRRTYGDAESGSLLALVGSHGWVEMAMNGGNAQAQLNLNVGDLVTLIHQNQGA